MDLQINDKVKLNKSGVDCLERNRDNKNIQDKNAIFIIVGHMGYDSGRSIYKLKHESIDDFYYGEHLIRTADKL